MKILLKFLSVSENKRTNVGFFIKTKWHTVSFRKEGYSLLNAPSVYERFHRNTLLLDSGGNLDLNLIKPTCTIHPLSLYFVRSPTQNTWNKSVICLWNRPDKEKAIFVASLSVRVLKRGKSSLQPTHHSPSLKRPENIEYLICAAEGGICCFLHSVRIPGSSSCKI